MVPVINENDTVSVEEIKFGDNDALAAMVVDICEADLLVILTDAGGVFSADPRKDPRAERLPLIEKVTSAIEALARRRSVERRHRRDALEAASGPRRDGGGRALRDHLAGRQASCLRLFAGEDVGTLSCAQGERQGLRQRWMLDLKGRAANCASTPRRARPRCSSARRACSPAAFAR